LIIVLPLDGIGPGRVKTLLVRVTELACEFGRAGLGAANAAEIIDRNRA